MTPQELHFICSSVRLALAKNIGNKLTEELAEGLVGALMRDGERAIAADHPIPLEQFSPVEYGGYRFAAERAAQCLEELKPLHQKHWQETEMYRHGLHLDPDYEYGLRMEASGHYLLFTVREVGSGNLVGNLGQYIQRSMHTKTLVATEDTLFIDPTARKGRVAIKFIQYIEQCMRQLGVVEWQANTKLTNRTGKLLEHLGFEHVANQYVKILRN